MNENASTKPTGLANVLGLVKKYSFVLVFLAILLVYVIANGGLTLNAFGEHQYHHEVAVKLIRASHIFDFGLPCHRNEQILVWESRLVAFADYYAADEAPGSDHERTGDASVSERTEER